jgi:hypothetical protein
MDTQGRIAGIGFETRRNENEVIEMREKVHWMMHLF